MRLRNKEKYPIVVIDEGYLLSYLAHFFVTSVKSSCGAKGKKFFFKVSFCLVVLTYSKASEPTEAMMSV